MVATRTAVDPEPWIEGAAIGDERLAARVAALWADALAMGGDEAVALRPRSFAEAQQFIAEATVVLVGVLETPGATADATVRHTRAGQLLAALGAAGADLRDAVADHRNTGLRQVQQAVTRLRGLGGVSSLLKVAAQEVCQCGFDRAIVLRIEGGTARTESVHDIRGAEAVERLVLATRNPIELTPALPEADMLRRRGPILVGDPQALASGYRPLIESTQTRSYVGAPIVAQHEVIGIVVADGIATRRHMDATDRELLWYFAQELGRAYERAQLLERLAALRQEIRRANRSILAVMDDYAAAGVEIVRADGENGVLTQSAATMFVADDSRIDRVLTRRELDVAELMAVGETNAAIAARLVVSEATVKSHVKNILRKLRASNRAEAVARIIALSAGHGGRG